MTDEKQMPEEIWVTKGIYLNDPLGLMAHRAKAWPDGVCLKYTRTDLYTALKEENERLRSIVEFYSNDKNFIFMDGQFYEYGDRNVDLTQYRAMGKRAREALAARDAKE